MPSLPASTCSPGDRTPAQGGAPRRHQPPPRGICPKQILLRTQCEHRRQTCYGGSSSAGRSPSPHPFPTLRDPAHPPSHTPPPARGAQRSSSTSTPVRSLILQMETSSEMLRKKPNQKCRGSQKDQDLHRGRLLACIYQNSPKNESVKAQTP